MGHPLESCTSSDTVAGYVIKFDDHHVTIRTRCGEIVVGAYGANFYGELMTNLGEDRVTLSRSETVSRLHEGLYVFAYGVFYPVDNGVEFVIINMWITEDEDKNFLLEDPCWWVKQAANIADFYLTGQFPDGVPQWRASYRTELSLEGQHTETLTRPSFRQETDTVSRMVYGMATAYLLTGEDRFLEAAESGTQYLREHMRVRNDLEEFVYWYHGVDISPSGERKIFASEFGDDYDAIPIYEQIYALAGPTQTFRITGDPRIQSDIDETISLFEKFFRDTENDGYFSHVDPVTFSPHERRLGQNAGRKNWNSIGDHAPAYLINAYLATEREDYADFLRRTAKSIVERFPDTDQSPFVQERFFSDWTPDRSWGWQQDRAVVGHNLKIAWNLTRLSSLSSGDSTLETLSHRLADTMPGVGLDRFRGGWFDVVERQRDDVSGLHMFAWHDRKAWWQQEQAILAYLILAGVYNREEHHELAKEASAFYNAFFLDRQDGGIYFNVLASGIPYLVGNERMKGSHSMSCYHSIELCYLAAVYLNLLILKEPLELHFKPSPEGFSDGLLRVAPDLLPKGRVVLSEVWVNGQPYQHFDRDAMTVDVPRRRGQLKIRVRLCPSDMPCDVSVLWKGNIVRITARGQFDNTESALRLSRVLSLALENGPKLVELDLGNVTEFSRGALNELLLLRAKADVTDVFKVVSASPDVLAELVDTDAFDLREMGFDNVV